jgi:hypothetical protein
MTETGAADGVTDAGATATAREQPTSNTLAASARIGETDMRIQVEEKGIA